LSDPITVFSALRSAMPGSAMTSLLILSIVLFSPDDFLNTLGVTGFVDNNRFVFGILWIVSLGGSVAAVAKKASEWIRKWRKRGKFPRYLKDQFSILSDDEKQVLRIYVDGNVSTCYFYINNGSVNSLIAKHILFRTGAIGSSLDKWPTSIQPEAMKLLRGNKKYLN
jgi:hypothetical protein